MMIDISAFVRLLGEEFSLSLLSFRLLMMTMTHPPTESRPSQSPALDQNGRREPLPKRRMGVSARA